MANFKRGRRKNARAGCLFCKSYKTNGKQNGLKSQPMSVRRLGKFTKREQTGDMNE